MDKIKIKFFDRKHNKIALWIIPVLLFAILSMYLLISGDKYIRLFPCPFFELTDYACPGCGGTRAVSSIAKLDFFTAIKYNLLVVVLFGYLVVLWFICGYKIFKHNLFMRVSLKQVLIIGVLIVVWGFIRNLDIYPFKITSPWGEN